MPPTPPDSPVGRASGPESCPPERADEARAGGSSRSRRRRPATSRAARPTTRPNTPSPPRSTPPRTALETLLADLGSQIQRGPARETADQALAAARTRFHPTGLEALDARLGGGFPHGRLSEICGAEAAPRGSSADSTGRTFSTGRTASTGRAYSTGRTALAHALAAETLSRGVLVAWIDLADAYDPNAALEAILNRGDAPDTLDRLLWVRAQTEDEALRCCERIMRTEGFELVVLDVLRPALEAPLRSRRRRAATPPPLRDVTWLRLARLAPSTRTALVALTDAPSTGSRADLVLEMCPETPRFTPPPHLLESIEARAVLRRHRSRPRAEVDLEFEAGCAPGR